MPYFAASEELSKTETTQQNKDPGQVKGTDITSRAVSTAGLEFQQLLRWAEKINNRYGAAFFNRENPENRMRLAYIIYDEELGQRAPQPDRFRQYELFDQLKEFACKNESTVRISLKKNGKYYPPTEAEKLDLDILQGPWFLTPKGRFSTTAQPFQARFSITVNDQGYLPLLALLAEISDTKHPLHSIVRGCKIYGPELIGYSTDTAIIYLNSSELNSEKIQAVTTLFVERIDKFSAPDIPCGMQRISRSTGYAETPNGATSSYGMHRAEIIVFALEKYCKGIFSSLASALEDAYQRFGLKTDNPALCVKATE